MDGGRGGGRSQTRQSTQTGLRPSFFNSTGDKHRSDCVGALLSLFIYTFSHTRLINGHQTFARGGRGGVTGVKVV